MSTNKFQFSTEKYYFWDTKKKVQPNQEVDTFFFFSLLEYITSEYKLNMIPKLKDWPYQNVNVKPKILWEDIKP